MADAISFAMSTSKRAQAAATFPERPGHGHAVQFYEGDEFLFETVARYLGAGLEAGDRLIVIATAEHRDGFTRRLAAAEVERAIACDQLLLLDARETLASFMSDGMPDPALFQHALERVLARSERGRPGARVRAYGEMVDLLWRDGNSRAAIRLEELWNEAAASHEFALLCAYVMGNFYNHSAAADIMHVVAQHDHVMPGEEPAASDDNQARLREIAALRQRAHALEHEIKHRRELEEALRDALKERARVEEHLRASLRREAEAREEAEASDAFKQVFLGILGHDLRNPLSTILTTARMMAMRQLPADEFKKVRRIISSGDRMRRMVDQILDVTRARLARGIPIERRSSQDLAVLVSRIAEEVRASHPQHVIELGAEGSVVGSFDSARLEQVVCNLLGNAATHGDPTRPIRAELHVRGGSAVFSVHNHGTPIDPGFMPLLFDPFKRGGQPQGRSEGLGLGLYISQSIVAAHGGKIEVESSAQSGTRFEVTLPLA